MTLYEDELPIDEPGEFKYPTDWSDSDLESEKPRVTLAGGAFRAEEDSFFGDLGHNAAEEANAAGDQEQERDEIDHNAIDEAMAAEQQEAEEDGDDELEDDDNEPRHPSLPAQPAPAAQIAPAPLPVPAPNPAAALPGPIVPAVRKLIPKSKWSDAEDSEVLRLVEVVVLQQQRQLTIQDCSGIEASLAAAFQGRWTSVGDGLVRGTSTATAEWLYPARNARAIDRRLKSADRLLPEYNTILSRYGVAEIR